MKTGMKTGKKTAKVAGLVLGLACWAGSAFATGTTQDSVTVTITPIANYLLLVTTGAPAGGLNLGAVAVGASTFTVNPTTVTVYSSYATTGLQLKGIDSGAGSIETAPGTGFAQLASDSDKVGIWAVFTDTGMAALPTGGLEGAAFAGTVAGYPSSTVVGTSYVNVGGSAGPRDYVLAGGTAHYKSMSAIPTFTADAGGSAAELWLGLQLSPVTTLTQGLSQTLTVVLQAVAAF